MGILIKYDFVLTYIPGKKNPTDRLSYCPDYVKDIELLESYVIPRNMFHDNIIRVYAAVIQLTIDICKCILETLKNNTVAK